MFAIGGDGQLPDIVQTPTTGTRSSQTAKPIGFFAFEGWIVGLPVRSAEQTTLTIKPLALPLLSAGDALGARGRWELARGHGGAVPAGSATSRVPWSESCRTCPWSRLAPVLTLSVAFSADDTERPTTTATRSAATAASRHCSGVGSRSAPTALLRRPRPHRAPRSRVHAPAGDGHIPHGHPVVGGRRGATLSSVTSPPLSHRHARMTTRLTGPPRSSMNSGHRLAWFPSGQRADGPSRGRSRVIVTKGSAHGTGPAV